MASDKPHCVLVVDGDERALRATTRWLTIIVSVGLAVCFLAFGSIYVLCRMYPDQMSGVKLAALPLVLGSIVVIWVVAVGGLRLCTRHLAKRVHVTIGDDFLIAPLGGPTTTLACITRFGDIRCVDLDLSKGRISGAIVRAKARASLRGIKDPATIIRTIFERTGPEVKWRQSVGLWRRRLTRDQVRGLVEDSGGKDIGARLPPDAAYATADECLDRSNPREILHLTCNPPTPAERYVNLLLMEMSPDGLGTRTLKRSEILPSIRFRDEKVEPPPVDDVVNRLKLMCALKPRRYRKPVDGTMGLTLNLNELGPRQFKVTCHFDDQADACCTIRMEPAEAGEEG